MVGILLVSHCSLASEFIEAAKMVFGEVDEQVIALGLGPDDNPDLFEAQIKKALLDIDAGEGVYILADIRGGTPFNRAAACVGDGVTLLSGLNLMLFLELLGLRLSGQTPDLEELLAVARDNLSVFAPPEVDDSNDIL